LATLHQLLDRVKGRGGGHEEADGVHTVTQSSPG